MKNKIILIAVALAFVGCMENPKTFKHVVSVSNKSHTYKVKITEQHGGNALSRAAGGAVLGGGVNWMLGGKFSNGAIVGGVIGAATTQDPEFETREEMRTDIIYTIKFSDSTTWVSTNYCPFRVGDSVEDYRYR